jgi:peroxiredoxin
MIALIALCALLLVLSGCDQGPIAVLNAAIISGPAPLEVAFDLSHCEDRSGTGISYILDFGDGSPATESNAFNIIVHHTYEVGGIFPARLTVIDGEGQEERAQLTITVDAAGPTVGIIVGTTAPDFIAHTTDGGEITLSDFRESVVLLEFWGAWCFPCKESMPHLQDLYDQYAESGLIVIAVSTDVQEQDAIDFLASNGYDDFVSVWESGGKSGSPITQLYGVSSSLVGVPRTFLLDRQGVIRYVGHPENLSSQFVGGIL